MRGLKELNKSRNDASKGPKEVSIEMILFSRKNETKELTRNWMIFFRFLQQQQFVPDATYFTKSWNKAIEYVQDAARKD